VKGVWGGPKSKQQLSWDGVLVEGILSEGVFVTRVGDRFLISCISYCSYAVRVARVVLMLFLVLFYLLESCCKWL